MTVSQCKVARGSSVKAAGPVVRRGIDKRKRFLDSARLCSFDASVDVTSM
jgi:hypothetical protein